MRKLVLLFGVFFLILDLSAQDNIGSTMDKKIWKKFQKQVVKPLDKSSREMKNGRLEFIESVYGNNPKTNHYILTWVSNYSVKVALMPLISLQINDDSIYYYSPNRVCLYNLKSKNIIYTKSIDTKEYIQQFLLNDFFTSYYLHWINTGGSPSEFNVYGRKSNILSGNYYIKHATDNKQYLGKHSFILNKSTNILQQYSYEPANPQEVGYSQKLYQVIDYKDIINMDFPNEVFQLFNNFIVTQ